MGDSVRVSSAGGARGRSGEHTLSSQEQIAAAVATAMAQVLPELLQQARSETGERRDIQELRLAIGTQIDRLEVSTRTEIGKLSTQVDGVRQQLADGNTRFALLERDVKSHDTRLNEHSDRIYTPNFARTQGSSSALMPARGRSAETASSKKDVPLISNKVWNTLILGLVGAVGAAGGGFIWDRLRAPDKAETTIATVTSISQPMQQPATGPVVTGPKQTPPPSP